MENKKLFFMLCSKAVAPNAFQNVSQSFLMLLFQLKLIHSAQHLVATMS